MVRKTPNTNASMLMLPGPVVRVSPNELSFAAASSWKDIYGSPASGRRQFVKSEFYSMYGAGFTAKCIGSERDLAKHKWIRGLLSSVFSKTALLEQEQIVHQHVDGFVEKLKPCEGDVCSERDLTAWYSMLAFDLMGDMGFGESFHAIETGETA
jgi:cytochrome P450